MRPMVTLEFEETPRDLDSQPIFPRDCVPLRKDNAPHVILLKDAKYPLVMPEIPQSVIIEGDLMGKVDALNFSNHNIKNAQKVPKLAREKYLLTKILPRTCAILVKPQSWVRGMKKSGMLNLLEILNFGRSLEINGWVNILLSFIHRGTLCIYPKVYIEIQLVAWISRFSIEGEDSTTLFTKRMGRRHYLKI
jgi:hypothetical protein